MDSTKLRELVRKMAFGKGQVLPGNASDFNDRFCVKGLPENVRKDLESALYNTNGSGIMLILEDSLSKAIDAVAQIEHGYDQMSQLLKALSWVQRKDNSAINRTAVQTAIKAIFSELKLVESAHQSLQTSAENDTHVRLAKLPEHCQALCNHTVIKAFSESCTTLLHDKERLVHQKSVLERDFEQRRLDEQSLLGRYHPAWKENDTILALASQPENGNGFGWNLIWTSWWKDAMSAAKDKGAIDAVVRPWHGFPNVEMSEETVTFPREPGYREVLSRGWVTRSIFGDTPIQPHWESEWIPLWRYMWRNKCISETLGEETWPKLRTATKEAEAFVDTLNALMRSFAAVHGVGVVLRKVYVDELQGILAKLELELLDLYECTIHGGLDFAATGYKFIEVFLESTKEIFRTIDVPLGKDTSATWGQVVNEAEPSRPFRTFDVPRRADSLATWEQVVCEAEPSRRYSSDGLPAGRYLTGLQCMDMSFAHGIRINALPADSNGGPYFGGSEDSVLYQSKLNWLELPLSIQKIAVWGDWDSDKNHFEMTDTEWTLNVNLWGDHFSSPPCVRTWFTRIDASHETDLHLDVYATKIHESGFSLVVRKSPQLSLKGVRLGCIAYPNDAPGIWSGNASVGGDLAYNANYVTKPVRGFRMDFPTGTFYKAPAVFMAVNAMHFTRPNNIRFEGLIEDVTKDGMTTRLSTWGDSDMSCVSCDVLAVA